MSKVSKVKEEVYIPTVLEVLATKMITDVYPQILSVMEELRDDSIAGDYEDMIVNFRIFKTRGGLEVTPTRRGAPSGYGSASRFVMDDGVFKDICPIFDNAAYNSNQYMNICEASIIVLENLKKRKQRVLKLSDKIDAIPTALHRSVLLEKFKK